MLRIFQKRRFVIQPALLGAVLLSFTLVQHLPNAAAQTASGIVHSIVKAPIAPDGDVAGAVTDFVINLAVDMNPSVSGKILRAGESIKIKLPSAFVFADENGFPINNLLSAKSCRPGNLQCSTGVLLQGWPQNPILPSFPPGKAPQYSFNYDKSSNTIIYTAIKDLVGVPLPGPGLKQMHLLLLGFRNPGEAWPCRCLLRSLPGSCA